MELYIFVIDLIITFQKTCLKCMKVIGDT